MDPTFSIIDTNSSGELVNKIRAVLNDTIIGCCGLSSEILLLPGMSGKKYRIFINNLISRLPEPRYLEIGIWAGSTLCAAIYKNKLRALAIDNWSQFGGPVDVFWANLDRFRGTAAVDILESDFRAVDFTTTGKFNVYMFDGPHDEQDQYDGVSIAQPALEDQFVLIVDDWNWKTVRSGTLRALSDTGLQLDFAAEIRTTLDDSHPEINSQNSDWHNGYFIAVCRKPRLKFKKFRSAYRSVIASSSRLVKWNTVRRQDRA